MRVLHWFPDFLEGGGIPNAILGLAAAQSRQGWQIMIAATGVPPGSRPLLGEPWTPCAEMEVLTWRPARSLRLGRQRWHLLPQREVARLRALRPDVLHVHGEFILDNLLASRLFRCPIVVTPHGALHPIVLTKSRQFAKKVYLSTERVLSQGRRKIFHALSPMESEHLAAVLPSTPTYCVPQGASPLMPGAPSRPTVMSMKGPETLAFVFLGRLDVFTKGLDIVLDAFERVTELSARRDLRLIFAGPDCKDGRAWLEQRITGRRIEDWVRFTGALSGAEAAAVLAEADVYVQLSRHEGFPLSVAEALLADKPSILSTAIGTISYPEIASLHHIKIVPPSREEAARAMLDAADHLPELTRAAVACRQVIRDFFSWDRIARLHLDRYLQLLSA